MPVFILTLVFCLLALAPISGQDKSGESGAQALTNQNIADLIQAGLGEDLIVNMVKTQPGAYSLAADDLINLKKARVPDAIIAVMLAKASAGPESRLTAPSTGILLAGTANNPKHIMDVLDGLMDRFTQAEISVTLIEGSRTDIIDQIKASGGSLLWITVDIAVGQLKDTVRAQFFDASGTEVWEEQASGGAFNFSSGGAIKNMTKKIFKKIERHLKEK